ncbi:hypothetical protein TNCT_212971 [Trichonephila clavata]|uniref:Uncharacterized protein n=1 Tax=Trichonephila clavata TaxID=2740835 RepID=A0A8X6F3P9_TRICU|nr:hypothetical protein TNCT_212971 [Trichonephila clavata]
MTSYTNQELPVSTSFTALGWECSGGPAILRGTISFETLAETKNFRTLASASQRTGSFVCVMHDTATMSARTTEFEEACVA